MQIKLETLGSFKKTSNNVNMAHNDICKMCIKEMPQTKLFLFLVLWQKHNLSDTVCSITVGMHQNYPLGNIMGVKLRSKTLVRLTRRIRCHEMLINRMTEAQPILFELQKWNIIQALCGNLHSICMLCYRDVFQANQISTHCKSEMSCVDKKILLPGHSSTPKTQQRFVSVYSLHIFLCQKC